MGTQYLDHLGALDCLTQRLVVGLAALENMMQRLWKRNGRKDMNFVGLMVDCCKEMLYWNDADCRWADNVMGSRGSFVGKLLNLRSFSILSLEKDVGYVVTYPRLGSPVRKFLQ